MGLEQHIGFPDLDFDNVIYWIQSYTNELDNETLINIIKQ